MKLATRISILAVTIAFVMSQLFNYIQLYRNRKWMAEQALVIYIQEYEDFYRDFQGRINDILGSSADSGYFQTDQGIRFLESYMSDRFQEKRGALYAGNRELKNGTDFDFQICNLQGDGMLSEAAVSGKICEENLQDGWLQWADVVSVESGEQLLVMTGSMRIPEALDKVYTLFYCVDLTEMFTSGERVFRSGAAAAILISIAMAVILHLLIAGQLGPLSILQKTADSIACGNYHERVPVVRKDEVGQIAENFNCMASHVQEHVESLDQANHAQKQLLAALAHELKTPMTALIGAVQTLRSIKVSPQQQERLLSYMEAECARLSRLSRKMQELCGLFDAEEKGNIKKETVETEKFLEKIKVLTDPLLERDGIVLVIESEGTLLPDMDEDLAVSLVLNLIDNARKASGSGDRIILYVSDRKLQVRDAGKGIPKQEIERITEAFYMVDKSRSRAAGGIGLGLAICQQIVQIHGWKMKIESREGQGTTVTVSFTERLQKVKDPVT